MVTVQIYATNKELEILDPSITYVKTAGDLGSITNVNSSYSWTFKIPKTPQNTIELEGLGLVGSGSRKPYQKVYCNVLDNGFPIVIKGILNIRDTVDDFYNAYVQEGFIDFLKDINNKTIGEGLDLSELNHTRNYETIVDSFDLLLPYAYLIADVNGAYLNNVSNTTNLNPLFMAPYANVGYIFDLIFSTYGWTYQASQSVIDSINDTWMSYPSEVVLITDDSDVVGELSGGPDQGYYFPVPSDFDRIYRFKLPTRTLDSDFFVPLNTSNFDFVVQQTGDYEFSFESTGSARYKYAFGIISYPFPYSTVLLVNGTVVNDYAENTSGGQMQVHQISLNAGDVISMGAGTYRQEGYGSGYQDIDVLLSSASMEIKNIITEGEVSFTQALIKLKISDFLKEVMTREALTPFVDSENKNIDFLTLEERASAEAVDWTEKYVKRTKESYLYLDYAQQNWMRHKYPNELEDHNDGSLTIDNENLEEEKTVYQSLSFSPDRRLSTFTSEGTNYRVPRLPMFNVEVKEDEVTGDLIGTYKFISGRFFFVKSDPVTHTIYIENNQVDGFPLANINGNIFRDIVYDKYQAFNNFAEDAKVHDIELALSLSDILQLDLKKLYYFENEAAFYILNRLSYKTGQKTKGEFLKIQPKAELRAFSNAFSGAFNI